MHLGFARTSVILLAVAAMISCSSWFGHDADRFGAPDSTLAGTPSCREVDPIETDVRWPDVIDDKSDQEELLRWCRTVGTALARTNTPPDAGSTLDSLAIVTWNIHVGGGDLIELVNRLRAGELTNGHEVHHFVLLLQEVHREDDSIPMDAPDDRVPERIAKTPPSGERLDIVEAAARLDLDLFYVPSMRNGSPGSGPAEEDRGNAILSTLHLHDLTAIELPMERFRRVAVAATVRGVSTDGRQWSLRVCSTHLDTRSGFPRYFESVGIGRLRQAKALLSALPESPAVLGGDFNTWAPDMLEGTPEFIRERFRHPEELDDRPTIELAILPDRRVDYLFFDLPDGFTAHYCRLDDRLGSDHYPLLGCVTFSSPVP